jgi:hypothetical protein
MNLVERGERESRSIIAQSAIILPVSLNNNMMAHYTQYCLHLGIYLLGLNQF